MNQPIAFPPLDPVKISPPQQQSKRIPIDLTRNVETRKIIISSLLVAPAEIAVEKIPHRSLIPKRLRELAGNAPHSPEKPKREVRVPPKRDAGVEAVEVVADDDLGRRVRLRRYETLASEMRPARHRLLVPALVLARNDGFSVLDELLERLIVVRDDDVHVNPNQPFVEREPLAQRPDFRPRRSSPRIDDVVIFDDEIVAVLLAIPHQRNE